MQHLGKTRGEPGQEPFPRLVLGAVPALNPDVEPRRVSSNMSTKEPGSRAAPGRINPSSRARDGREAVRYDKRTYCTKNALITIEDGPAGPIAKIKRFNETPDYAGPIPMSTITALAEVAE